jgi:hypothetical protein
VLLDLVGLTSQSKMTWPIISIFHWSDIKISSFVKNQKVEVLQDSPYKFERATEIWIFHERLEWSLILLLLDWSSCSELQANLSKCQIFWVVRYFVHDGYFVHYRKFPTRTTKQARYGDSVR